MTTYDENGGYPHPDHIMCHKVVDGGVRGRARPGPLPRTGEPWQPLKLYYDIGFSRERFEALDKAMIERGLESPFEEMRKRWAGARGRHGLARRRT